jgi:large subunit ribosomal protein L10
MAKVAVVSHQPTKYLGRGRKETLVAEFADKVGKSKAFVFTNYQGLTHHQLEALKKAAKKVDAEFVVTKNTLLLRALEGKVQDSDRKYFEQPTATLFIYNDIIEPLKELAKTIKEINLPQIKFAIVESKPLSSDEVIRLSTLPPLPVLRAQLLGQMLSPIQGLHRALNWNMQSLVMTLNQIAQKRQ